MIGKKAWTLMVYILVLCLRHATARALLQDLETSSSDHGSSIWKQDVKAGSISALAKRAGPRASPTGRPNTSLTRSHSAPGSLARESIPVSRPPEDMIDGIGIWLNNRQRQSPADHSTNSQHQETSASTSTTSSQQPRRWQPNRIITTTAGPSRSMISVDRGRPSLRSDRSRRRYRDLVRSVSPPRPIESLATPRASSLPPTGNRRINSKAHLYAHPLELGPTTATVGMVGPGIITLQSPNNRLYRTVVPAHSMAVRHTNHPQLSSMGGETLSQGMMVASSSGAQVVSGMTTGKGRGGTLVNAGSGESKIHYYENRGEGGAWARQLPGDPEVARSFALLQGQGEIQAVGCNDPQWCDSLWNSRRARQG